MATSGGPIPERSPGDYPVEQQLFDNLTYRLRDLEEKISIATTVKEIHEVTDLLEIETNLVKEKFKFLYEEANKALKEVTDKFEWQKRTISQVHVCDCMKQIDNLADDVLSQSVSDLAFFKKEKIHKLFLGQSDLESVIKYWILKITTPFMAFYTECDKETLWKRAVRSFEFQKIKEEQRTLSDIVFICGYTWDEVGYIRDHLNKLYKDAEILELDAVLSRGREDNIESKKETISKLKNELETLEKAVPPTDPQTIVLLRQKIEAGERMLDRLIQMQNEKNVGQKPA